MLDASKTALMTRSGQIGVNNGPRCVSGFDQFAARLFSNYDNLQSRLSIMAAEA